MVRRLRGRRAGRRDRQAPRPALPARQARDGQDQAPAYRRLRGGGVPLAQERAGDHDRVAAAGAVERRRAAAARRASPSSFTEDKRRELVEFLEPYRANAVDGHPWQRMEGVRGAVEGQAAARRHLALEPRQGPLVGAAASRAGLRGGLRPPPGRPIPPRGDLQALAPGQATGRAAATTSSRRRRRPCWPTCSARARRALDDSTEEKWCSGPLAGARLHSRPTNRRPNGGPCVRDRHHCTDPNAAINEIADRFFDGVLEREPIFATILGDDRFDDRLPDLGAEGRAVEARVYRAAARGGGADRPGQRSSRSR